VTHQDAARDAASIHFRPIITRTDILVKSTLCDCFDRSDSDAVKQACLWRRLFCSLPCTVAVKMVWTNC